MSFKDLEQKHNLVNMIILACGKHPVDADINPLLEERLERFYEDAVIEGMAKPWVGLTGIEINHVFAANVGYPERMCRAIEAALRKKNGGI